MPTHRFSGVWSYRALYNDPDLSTVFNDLRFATAELRLREPQPGRLSGELIGMGWGTWTEWRLVLSGEAAVGAPDEFRLQGVNDIEGEKWVYDYQGFLMPQWPHAEAPQDVLVGSVIRSAGRARNDARAGVTATFYAVKLAKA